MNIKNIFNLSKVLNVIQVSFDVHGYAQEQWDMSVTSNFSYII